VRPVRVVVAGMVAQDQPQVPFAGDQYPVQALAAGAARPAFGDRLRARRPDRCLDDPQPGRGEHRVERRGELGVPVPDQEFEALFEPVWNRKHIAYVQIDVPETLSIEGRADFYDHTGAYRDMIVTHLFQVLGFVAMEPPTSLDARHLRAETAKVFDALKPLDPRRAVRGQYTGYRHEPGVAPGSDTETLAAVRAEIDNWRWAGVPFFLRSGKNLAASRQQVTLGFHEPPLRMFPVHVAGAPNGRRNEITIDFADPGSITTSFLAKQPGPAMKLGAAEMTFRYADSPRAASTLLEGYQRLLLDAMIGDQSLFTSDAAIERLWEISAPLLEDPPPIKPYAPGSWGRASA
jgi:glucose-6-phosphate 1-dehydrogenase